MKLATTSADFRKFTPEAFEPEIIRYFKDTKFKYLNLSLSTANVREMLLENDDGYKKVADLFAKEAENADVTYVMAHAPCLYALKSRDTEETYKNTILCIRRSIQVCHELNIPRIVIHSCPEPTYSVDKVYHENKVFYEEFLDLAEKHNIMLLTENWDDDNTHFSLGQQMREFIDYVDHPLLVACWDSAHGHISPTARELGQYENIMALGDKLKGLHISDNFGNMHQHSWPYSGTINFDQIMQGLLDVKYDGYFTYEACYTLLHHTHFYKRKPWEYHGETVAKALDPSIKLMQSAVDLLYDIGEYMLRQYDCFEE